MVLIFRFYKRYKGVPNSLRILYLTPVTVLYLSECSLYVALVWSVDMAQVFSSVCCMCVCWCRGHVVFITVGSLETVASSLSAPSHGMRHMMLSAPIGRKTIFSHALQIENYACLL